jgi:hypothetical protein
LILYSLEVPYSYDINGRLSAEILDKNHDGVADTITSYNYDTNGKLISAAVV